MSKCPLLVAHIILRSVESITPYKSCDKSSYSMHPSTLTNKQTPWQRTSPNCTKLVENRINRDVNSIAIKWRVQHGFSTTENGRNPTENYRKRQERAAERELTENGGKRNAGIWHCSLGRRVSQARFGARSPEGLTFWACSLISLVDRDKETSSLLCPNISDQSDNRKWSS